MKYRGQWSFIPIAIATLASISALTVAPAWANKKVVETPLQGRQTFPITSSTQAAQCNSPNNQPEAVQVDVTEGLTSLNFAVSGNSGQPTLRVIDQSNGQETCVMADNLSGSQVELSAAWANGSYSVYVGDRNGEAHNFTLAIRQTR